MPGPLSSTMTTKRPSPFVRSPSPFAPRARSRTSIAISGRIPASSQASSELSTASLIVVRSAFDGLSKPRRCRFFVKNSEIEISRCFDAICSAVARRLGVLSRGAGSAGRSSGAGAGSANAAAGGRFAPFPPLAPFAAGGGGSRDPLRGTASTGTSSSCFETLPAGVTCAFGEGLPRAFDAALPVRLSASAFRPIGS